MTIFKETQKFNQPMIWVGMIFIGLIMTSIFGFGIYRQIIQGVPFGNNPMSDNGLIITFVLTILLFICLVLLFRFARLSTIIDQRGIEYRFFPFQLKYHKINWDEIEKKEVITYKPIRDYGGWGMRFNRKGKAFNVSGDKGIQLYLKNGKQILIGTQKETELADFLKTLK
jgi:hypothetical protein